MERLIKIFLLFLIISFLVYSILDAFAIVGTSSAVIPAKEKKVEIGSLQQEFPVRIVIPDAGVDASIEQPVSVNISALDESLTRGAVHYPGSGYPGVGNMFLFGHSTNWKYVRNQAYKTFNNIQNLEKGDVVEVYTDNAKYLYRVLSVRLADDSEVLVDFDGGKDMLTISTCNTFGEKQERFVVEADFVRKVPIE